MDVNNYFSDKIAIEQKLINILRSKRAETHYYGNHGQKIYDKNNKLSYTFEDAKARKEFVARLLVENSHNPFSKGLGERLKNCTAFNRCGSGACSCETRAISRIFCEAGSNLIGSQPNEYFILSNIPLARRYKGDLARYAAQDVEILKERTAKVFKKADIKVAFGGLDISVNSHETGKFTEHYKWHLWVLAKTNDSERLKALLKGEFPSSPSVPLPVMVKAYDGRVNAMSYALKYSFQQRISRDNLILADGTVKRLSPKPDRLRNHEHIEIAHALNEVGLAGRVFTHGLDLGMIGGFPRFILEPQGKGG